MAATVALADTDPLKLSSKDGLTGLADAHNSGEGIYTFFMALNVLAEWVKKGAEKFGGLSERQFTILNNIGAKTAEVSGYTVFPKFVGTVHRLIAKCKKYWIATPEVLSKHRTSVIREGMEFTLDISHMAQTAANVIGITLFGPIGAITSGVVGIASIVDLTKKSFSYIRKNVELEKAESRKDNKIAYLLQSQKKAMIMIIEAVVGLVASAFTALAYVFGFTCPLISLILTTGVIGSAVWRLYFKETMVKDPDKV
jgi:hypothetical protein